MDSARGRRSWVIVIFRTDQLHEVLLQGAGGQVGTVPVRPGHLLLGSCVHLSHHCSGTVTSAAGTGGTAGSCGPCSVPSSTLAWPGR